MLSKQLSERYQNANNSALIDLSYQKKQRREWFCATSSPARDRRAHARNIRFQYGSRFITLSARQPRQPWSEMEVKHAVWWTTRHFAATHHEWTMKISARPAFCSEANFSPAKASLPVNKVAFDLISFDELEVISARVSSWISLKPRFQVRWVVTRLYIRGICVWL